MYRGPVIENQFGQPVGEDLGAWIPPTNPPEHGELRGQYVTLEPLQRTQHAIPLFHAFKQSGEEMWTYMPLGPFGDAAELGQLLGALEKDRRTNAYAALVNNEPTGFLSHMRIRPDEGVLEIGWVTFATAMQRTAASTEAVFLLLGHAFSSGFRRVEWKCDALNAPSRRAAERFGFVEEGIFSKATHYKGRNRDTAWLALTNDAWPTIEAGFHRWLDPSNFDESGAQRTRLGAG